MRAVTTDESLLFAQALRVPLVDLVGVYVAQELLGLLGGAESMDPFDIFRARFAAIVAVLALGVFCEAQGIKQIFVDAVGDYKQDIRTWLRALAAGQVGSALDRFSIEGSAAQRARPGPAFLKSTEPRYIDTMWVRTISPRAAVPWLLPGEIPTRGRC